jgi:hypothetical protein
MKTHAWLLAVSFIPFSIFGFLFAQFSTHGIKQPDPAVPITTTQGVRTQTNILFISVDMDAKPNPRLVSVWGLFFTSLNQNAAEFVSLYPSKNSLKDTILLSEFTLDTNQNLDSSFVELTQKAFQVKWDAYFVISQKDIEKISKRLEKDIDLSDVTTAFTGPDMIFLQQLCSFLISDAMTLDFHHILETQILDNNISSSQVSAFDRWVENGQPFSSCEAQP